MRVQVPSPAPNLNKGEAMKQKITDKKEVRENIESWDQYWFDGDMDEIVDKIKAFKKKHSKGNNGTRYRPGKHPDQGNHS